MDNKQAIIELKCLREDYWEDDGYGHETKEYEDTMVALDMAIKALEQESKIGYWIKYGIPRCEEQHYKCTSCGYYINFGRWGEYYAREFKHCPHCGVKMKGEKEDEV